jgi:hypothetical protein
MNSANARNTPVDTTSNFVDPDGSRKGRRTASEPGPREVAHYVSDMILELRNMAKSAKLFKVMVPLEFAYYEAFNAANQVDIPKEELERLRQLAEIGQALDVAAEEPAPAKTG